MNKVEQEGAVHTVLLVSERRDLSRRVSTALNGRGWLLREVGSVLEAEQEMRKFPARVLLLDGWAAITRSAEALNRIIASQPRLAVVVCSFISLEERQAQHAIEEHVKAVYTESNGSSPDLLRLLSQVLEDNGGKEEVRSTPINKQ
jgi:DNA-binding NtrC family response regulator